MSGPKRNGNGNSGKARKRDSQSAALAPRTGASRKVAVAGIPARAQGGASGPHARARGASHTHTLTAAAQEVRLAATANSRAISATDVQRTPAVAPLERETIPVDEVIAHAQISTGDSALPAEASDQLLPSSLSDEVAPPIAAVTTRTTSRPAIATSSVVERDIERESLRRARFDVDRKPLGLRLVGLPSGLWTTLRGYTPEQYSWFGVLLLAAILRFWDLGGKPLHHDESMHAYFSRAFALDPASYSYNPLLHGPFQFHAEGIMFAVLMGLEHLLGQAQTWGDPWINDATARIVPALFGLSIVALPIWLRRELSRPGALLAAFLLAVSPAFVYFSRFLREDIYFNFFMFLMVVAAIRYASARSLKWFVTLFAAAVLAYATFEGTFLALAIFGSFLVVLAVWELAHSVALALPQTLTAGERAFFSRAGLLLLAGGLGAVVAYIGLKVLNNLSDYITNHQAASDAFIARLENQTVAIILYASILVALVVIGSLFWQMYRDDAAYAAQLARTHPTDPDNPFQDGFALEDATEPRALSRVERLDRVFTAPGRAKANLRARLDPVRQPFLRLVLGISWVQWFVAFVAGWMIFAALFWVLPGDGHSLGQGFQQGIGTGVWQGIYYWIEQQKVARGGQPWYYYLMLIPLYEQLACVFGIAGVIYSLARPSRFRLFLVWWFAVSLFLYSWAGEKMPWLSIHILLPLMLLAALALAAVLRGCVALVRQLASIRLSAVHLKEWSASREASWIMISAICLALFFLAEIVTGQPMLLVLLILALVLFVVALVRARIFRPTAAVLGATLALLLLIPMIHSMITLAYTDPANGPHEMMVYVQTTPDVDTVMQKIQQADQALYGGKHLLRIGVGPGQEWPFYWYLRDYPNSVFGYNASNPNAPKMDVVILSTAADGVGTPDTSDAFMALHAHDYTSRQYVLRSWWDEGYKPPPCIATKSSPCPASANWGSGVGPGLYLTYGDNPPPGAQFNFGIAAGRVWSWLWTRQAFGNSTGPYYNFVFAVRNGVPIKP